MPHGPVPGPIGGGTQYLQVLSGRGGGTLDRMRVPSLPPPPQNRRGVPLGQDQDIPLCRTGPGFDSLRRRSYASCGHTGLSCYAHSFRLEESTVTAVTLWCQPDVVSASVCTSAGGTIRESVAPATERPSTTRLKWTCLNVYRVRVYSHQEKAEEKAKQIKEQF